MSHLSDLQRLQDDPAANAPELTYSGIGDLEIDHKAAKGADAPEQVVSDDPQVKYDGAQLEVADSKTEDEDKVNNNASAAAAAVKKRKRKRRKILFLALAAFLCLCGLAIGLGVGLGLRKPLQRGISQGSSIAVATMLDSSRHVVFQDINGQLRHAVATQEAGAWDTSMGNVIKTNARASTPLASFLRVKGYTGHDLAEFGDELYLFYVDAGGILDLQIYTTNEGWGEPSSPMNFSKLAQQPISISTQSRNLAAVPLIDVNAVNQTNFGVLLLLHDASENIMVLYGSEQRLKAESGFEDSDGLGLEIVWEDVTPAFQQEIANDTKTTDCTFSNFAMWNTTAPSIYSVAVNCYDTAGKPITYLIKSTGNTTNATILPSFSWYEAISTSWPLGLTPPNSVPGEVLIKPNLTLPNNIVQPNTYQLINSSMSCCVPDNNGGTNGNPTTANSASFPFTNVGIANPAGSSSPFVYVYHQVSQSEFAEELWNSDAQSWTSSRIQVDTST